MYYRVNYGRQYNIWMCNTAARFVTVSEILLLNNVILANWVTFEVYTLCYYLLFSYSYQIRNLFYNYYFIVEHYESEFHYNCYT